MIKKILPFILVMFFALFARADDFLSNSPFQIASGTWAVEMDTIDGVDVKVIRCKTAGIIYVPTSLFQVSSTLSAYGTWKFYLKKADASALSVAFIAQATSITAGDYVLFWDTDESLIIDKNGGSAVVTGSTTSADTWHEFKITRAQSNGAFALYVDNIADGTGTDATLKASSYLLFDMDANDVASWSDLAGDHSIVKMQGLN